MKNSRFLVTLLIVAVAGCASAPAVRALPQHPITTKAVEAPKEADAPFPVPIIQLRGEPAELGTQHANQLGQPIRQLFGGFFDKYFQSNFERNIALVTATAFSPHISAEDRAEIHTLATGVKLDEREVLLGQCFLDLTAMTACSTVTLPASASPDGVARFGRNLDFPSFNVADKASVLLIFHPKGHYAFASVAWPGMIGVLSGMNEHGLALANMEVDRAQRLPVAMPYTLLYRTILERCKTVDEAISLLKSTPRQSANNLMLMDATGDRAVAEITPETVVVRRASDHQALISTNHHRGEDLDRPGLCPRYDYLHDASARHFGHIDRGEVQDMLAHVAQGNMTLQSMIFEPANGVIYLAVGANAPTHAYAKLDLKPYFR